jgi:hypothetical protein
MERMDDLVFQCSTCNTILSDSREMVAATVFQDVQVLIIRGASRIFDQHNFHGSPRPAALGRPRSHPGHAGMSDVRVDSLVQEARLGADTTCAAAQAAQPACDGQPLPPPLSAHLCALTRAQGPILCGVLQRLQPGGWPRL